MALKGKSVDEQQDNERSKSNSFSPSKSAPKSSWPAALLFFLLESILL
jgi:hypothetical protein